MPKKYSQNPSGCSSPGGGGVLKLLRFLTFLSFCVLVTNATSIEGDWRS